MPQEVQKQKTKTAATNCQIFKKQRQKKNIIEKIVIKNTATKKIT